MNVLYGTIWAGDLAALSVLGFDEDFAFGFEGVIEHWNGTAWKLVDSPVPDGALFGVTVLSARDAWAVGSGSGALIEHWNGTRWSATPVP